MTDLHTKGWAKFPQDPDILHWVAHARPAAEIAVNDPAHAHWLDCEGTWFIGVDALPNGPDGAVGPSAPLKGAVMQALAATGPVPPLHRAQVSVTWPGYPRPRTGEGEGAFRYRQNRDAAHVDGVRMDGPDRRRYVLEPHGFILGLPLNPAPANAAPLVVWEGSHHIMARAFQQAFAGHPPEAWPSVDVTDLYQAARREVFDTCPRIPLPAQPGEALLLHRLCLHGVAPWQAGPAPGRMIAYFRPELPGGIADWPMV